MAFEKKKYPVGALLEAKVLYTYGDEVPVDRKFESHNAGRVGPEGDYLVLLDYFRVENGSLIEVGVKAFSFTLQRILWIYERPLTIQFWIHP